LKQLVLIKLHFGKYFCCNLARRLFFT
jgi:hypothetical protein